MRKNKYKIWLTGIVVIMLAAAITIPILWNRHITDITHPRIMDKFNYFYVPDVQYTNGWRSQLIDADYFGGYYIVARVGSMTNDPDQGVADVYYTDRDGSYYEDVGGYRFSTPTEHGAIKVERLLPKNFEMIVKAKDGYQWILDVHKGFIELK